ncbi:hypothetical protein GCM10027167_67180 [Nocardia heshunensis]
MIAALVECAPETSAWHPLTHIAAAISATIETTTLTVAFPNTSTNKINTWIAPPRRPVNLARKRPPAGFQLAGAV